MTARTHTGALIGLTVLTVGIATRMIPWYWGPLPFNPDGFVFARAAEETAVAGRIVIDILGPHAYVFPTLLSELQLVTSVDGLTLTQPSIAIIGTIPGLFAVVFTRRLARVRGWPVRKTQLAALVGGLILVTEGLYLRRSAAVSYEVLGLVLVAASAYAFHQALVSRRLSWVGLLLPLLLVLPITHHLSSMMAALTLTAIAVAHLYRTGTLRVALYSLPAGGFWLYFGSYYIATQPPYFADLATKPGLFVAWVLVLPFAVILFQNSRRRTLQIAFAAPIVIGFVILSLHVLTDVFPGTASTNTQLLVYLAPVAIIAGLAGWYSPLAMHARERGIVILGLFLGPVMFVGFAVTAGLDPVYTAFARRAQTFVHLPVMVMAAGAVAQLSWQLREAVGDWSTGVLPSAVVVLALLSLPFAFASPPVLPYESTTTPSEFETVTFLEQYADRTWTSDDHLTRIGRNYYGANASPGATYDWLQGAPPPDCPVAVRASWTTTGAQAFPDDPIQPAASVLASFEQTQQLIYASGSERVVCQ